MHNEALHIIRSVQKKWMVAGLVSSILFSLAIALLPGFLLHRFFNWPLWTIVIFFILAFITFLLVDRSWQVKEKEVARFLNKTYPSLEESSELLFKNESSLNLLEQLQVAKTAKALQQIDMPSVAGKIKRPLIAIVVAGVVCWLLSIVLNPYSDSIQNGLSGKADELFGKLLTGVNTVRIKIVPASYTHKPAREQKNMNLEVEEGAAVRWEITLYARAREVTFIYNDSLTVSLHPLDKEQMVWTTDKILDHPGFYQVKIDSAVSELYRIEVIKDHPPVIVIASPKPNTVIEYGEPQRVNLQTTVSDDYGVKDVAINATVAKGNGEGVQFASHKISFGVSFAAQQLQYELQKTIGLASLGMQPGDELYFYIAATDNHGQEKRSDIYIVTITDTASLMNMEGLLNGVNLKPDYFRSQRQIILDAEQLLREKDTALVQNFNNRSNNLGIDQKLLRLRYGKFLGEEATSNDDVTGDHGMEDPANFGNAAVILDAFTDHHDNAEDATFLDPETKKQLKAVLNEMWSSELRLRLFKPQEALPFAYKALRLLKDLQQKSRAYVAKTSIKTAPIKLEKRLTGKLEKIIEPVSNLSIKPAANPVDDLRKALAVLEQLKNHEPIGEQSIQLLRLATVQVSNYAAKEPAIYLGALSAMKKIIDASQNKQMVLRADILVAEKALQRIARLPAVLPSKQKSIPVKLTEQYFENLYKNGQH